MYHLPIGVCQFAEAVRHTLSPRDLAFDGFNLFYGCLHFTRSQEVQHFFQLVWITQHFTQLVAWHYQARWLRAGSRWLFCFAIFVETRKHIALTQVKHQYPNFAVLTILTVSLSTQEQMPPSRPVCIFYYFSIPTYLPSCISSWDWFLRRWLARVLLLTGLRQIIAALSLKLIRRAVGCCQLSVVSWYCFRREKR